MGLNKWKCTNIYLTRLVNAEIQVEEPSVWFFRKKKQRLGITTLHNDMILSILSTSFRSFAFGFPKRPRTNEDVFLTYNHN